MTNIYIFGNPYMYTRKLITDQIELFKMLNSYQTFVHLKIKAYMYIRARGFNLMLVEEQSRLDASINLPIFPQDS